MKGIRQLIRSMFKCNAAHNPTLSVKFVLHADKYCDWLEVQYQDLTILGIAQLISTNSSRLGDRVFLRLKDDYEVFMTYYKKALQLSHEAFCNRIETVWPKGDVSAIHDYPTYYED